MNDAELTAEDHRYMARAVVLARRGIGLTDPNPSVGCVLVAEGEIVGEGTTAAAGGPHAEVRALAAAGALAAGATAYVTLEPCAHQGRTGPCTQALIAAGVARVVAASVDPFPEVAGRGLAELAEAGIAVAQGCLDSSARAVNPGYWSRLERGRPWIRLKLAASLDGRTALANGQSQWITGELARADVHRWRARSSAIMTGVGTVLADDPQLTARPPEPIEHVPPVRIVVDSRLRTPPAARLFDADGEVWIFHAPGADAAGLGHKAARVEAIGDGGNVPLAPLAARLAELDVNTIWVEAGAALAGALLEAGLVDELIVYMAPDLLGTGARGMADFGPLAALSDRLRWRFESVRRLGPDLRIVAVPATVADR